MVSGIQERVEQLVVGPLPVQIDVLGRPGPLGQSQVQRETALEYPGIRGNRDQAGQQTIERYPLAITGQARSIAGRTLLEPTLQGLAECRSIPDIPPLRTGLNTSRSTWPPSPPC